jgi:hypothetical protein
MNNTPRNRPNEIMYINIGSLKPFVENLNIPETQMQRTREKISKEKYASDLCEVVFNKKKGQYLVVGGYTTCYAYREVYAENLLIPCKVFYHLPKKELYLLTLEWMFKNNVTDWYNRHQIILKLHIQFHCSISELGTFFNKKANDIRFYLEPPESVKAETNFQRKERIINKISLAAFKHEHNKYYLYDLVLYKNVHVTGDHLIYMAWIRSNGIKFEECDLTPEQEHTLINRAIHLKRDFLNEIKRSIDEMRDRNGDPPIFDPG